VRDCLRLRAWLRAFRRRSRARRLSQLSSRSRPDTVIYEVKTGPYAKSNDKSFAPFRARGGKSRSPPAYMAQLMDELERREAVTLR